MVLPVALQQGAGVAKEPTASATLRWADNSMVVREGRNVRGGAPGGGPSGMKWRIAWLRSALTGGDAALIAARTGAVYAPGAAGGGELRLPVWGRRVAVSVPGFATRDVETGRELALDIQALLLYYFHASDGAGEEGRWISFSELPDGTFYQRAFQGYTGEAITRAFRNDLDAFARAAEHLGGRRLTFGDCSFSFSALPKVTLAAAYWRGDEELSPSARILFDASVSHHLPTDVCAILGAALTGRLTRLKWCQWRASWRDGTCNA